jgi:hypothetical protein
LGEGSGVPRAYRAGARTVSVHVINAIYLNNKTRNYLIEKAESSLPFLPILYVNFEASNALLRRLTYLILH